MTIGKNIAQLRKEKGISQQQMASELNVTRQTISKWENDLTLPNIDDLTKLSEYFLVSLESILNQKEDNENDIESVYKQLQVVFEKVEKETKKRSILNGCLIIVCCLSTIFTMTTGLQIRKMNDIYDQIQNTQDIYSSIIRINQLDSEKLSDYFMNVNTGNGSNSTYMDINKFDLRDRMVHCNYNFVLKEYSDDTTMSIEFDGTIYSLDKISENTFAFTKKIPLKNYDHVVLKIEDPNQYVIDFSIGENENCYYLKCILYMTTSFYLPIDYGPNLVELNKINYIIDPVNEHFQSLIGFRFGAGDIQLELFDENDRLLVSETFALGKKEEKELDIKLPVNQTLKVVATITVDNQEVVMNGVLSTTKKAENRVYVIFDKEVRYI